MEIEPTPDTGLATVGYAQCELVRSVSRRRLVHRLGVVDLATTRAVRDVLRLLLSM